MLAVIHIFRALYTRTDQIMRTVVHKASHHKVGAQLPVFAATSVRTTVIDDPWSSLTSSPM